MVLLMLTDYPTEEGQVKYVYSGESIEFVHFI